MTEGYARYSLCMAGKAKRPGAKADSAREEVLPLLEHLVRVGRRAYENAMPAGGLRPRHLIALKLLNDNGPQTQQSLTEVLALDPSNVVGLLNELEERELIVRRRDPADRPRHISNCRRAARTSSRSPMTGCPWWRTACSAG